MEMSNESMMKWRKALFDQLVKRGLEMSWEEFKRHFASTMPRTNEDW